MKIVLKSKTSSEKKTFSINGFMAEDLRNTLEFAKEVDLSLVKTDELDATVEYIVNLFERQFSHEELLKGVGADEILDLASKYKAMILHNITEKEWDEFVEEQRRKREAGELDDTEGDEKN